MHPIVRSSYLASHNRGNNLCTSYFWTPCIRKHKDAMIETCDKKPITWSNDHTFQFSSCLMLCYFIYFHSFQNQFHTYSLMVTIWPNKMIWWGSTSVIITLEILVFTCMDCTENIRNKFYSHRAENKCLWYSHTPKAPVPLYEFEQEVCRTAKKLASWQFLTMRLLVSSAHNYTWGIPQNRQEVVKTS